MQIFGNRNLLSVIRECLYFSISPSKSITLGSNKFCVAAPVDISWRLNSLLLSLLWNLGYSKNRSEIKKEDQQKYIKFVTIPLNFSCVLNRL